LVLIFWAIAIIGFILPLIIGRKVKAQMHERGDHEGSTSD
jgi:putative tricarboxylic transport membrane protein